jgi:hypothetical protein
MADPTLSLGDRVLATGVGQNTARKFRKAPGIIVDKPTEGSSSFFVQLAAGTKDEIWDWFKAEDLEPR